MADEQHLSVLEIRHPDRQPIYNRHMDRTFGRVVRIRGTMSALVAGLGRVWSVPAGWPADSMLLDGVPLMEALHSGESREDTQP